MIYKAEINPRTGEMPAHIFILNHAILTSWLFSS